MSGLIILILKLFYDIVHASFKNPSLLLVCGKETHLSDIASKQLAIHLLYKPESANLTGNESENKIFS